MKKGARRNEGAIIYRNNFYVSIAIFVRIGK